MFGDKLVREAIVLERDHSPKCDEKEKEQNVKKVSIFLPVWWEALQEKAISLFCLGLSVHVSRSGTIYLTFQSEAARLNSYSLFWRNVIAVEYPRLV